MEGAQTHEDADKESMGEVRSADKNGLACGGGGAGLVQFEIPLQASGSTSIKPSLWLPLF
jgi:hypothetical protein